MSVSLAHRSWQSYIMPGTLTKPHEQVEATTGKRPMLTKGNRLFSRVTKCTGITARPALTGIYKDNILNLYLFFIASFYSDVNTDVVVI